MGIPFWPTAEEGTTGRDVRGWSTPTDLPEPERAAESLSVLASPVRIAVLVALRNRGSLTYTDLMDATDVEDRGRFNYHLRELDDLLECADGRYALSDRGEQVVASVLTADGLGDEA